MKKPKITVGVDIGGTNTAIGFIDEYGNYLSGNVIPTKPEEDAEKFIIRLAGSIKILFRKFENTHSLSGIGVAAPSANYFKGTIESPSNLNWGHINFVDMMKEHFDLPVAITNDANAAALGEQTFGAAKGMKNFIVITLGTGLGSGIIIDGNILYGESGLAGELGHVIVEKNGRACKCGRSGCLETYVSATGICRTAASMLGHYNDHSELRNIAFSQFTGKIINELALKGDPIAMKAFQYTGEVLGKAIATIVACFAPESIILFGGLAEAGDLLLEPARYHFEKNLLSIYSGQVQILKSSLQEGRAAVYGASSLIANEIYRGLKAC